MIHSRSDNFLSRGGLTWICLCCPSPLLGPRAVLLGSVCSAPILWYATTLRHVYGNGRNMNVLDHRYPPCAS